MGSGASARKQARQDAEDDKKYAAKPRPPAPEYRGNPLPYMNLTDLPSDLILRVDGESLTILRRSNNMPLRHFAYYTIASWGHTDDSFQWKVFNRPELKPGEREADCTTYGFKTDKGDELERVVLKYVKLLMADMAKRGISQEKFKGIMGQISLQQSTAAIEEIEKGRAFTAHQCVSLIRLVEKICPFEKLDVATKLYSKMLNRDSFQLVANCFGTIEDRENLCYRLKIPATGGIEDGPAEMREREKLRNDNFPAICIDCLSGLDERSKMQVLARNTKGKKKEQGLQWNKIN
eukprot:g4966.t1